MLKLIAFISSNFIVIFIILSNQALSKTIDVDKFLNKNSLTANKKDNLFFKKYQLNSEFTPKLIEKEQSQKVNQKTLISQLKNKEGIKLISRLKTEFT
ncbi:MAG: ShlB/FhaC/HecB family hemolysin secretion/activation protein, partial [Trichodesmium sp.]